MDAGWIQQDMTVRKRAVEATAVRCKHQIHVSTRKMSQPDSHLDAIPIMGVAERLGTVDYRISESTTMRIGLRHLQFEYDGNVLHQNMSMTGPIMGATVRC